MSLLSQATGFFTLGKLKLKSPNTQYVDIYITTNGFEFIGRDVQFGALIYISTGFNFEIPWSNIRDITRSKAGLAYVLIIHTLDNFYTILPVDPEPKVVLSGTKKNSIELLATINEAKAYVEALKGNFCTNCGEQKKPDSDFCGKCGHKFS